MLFLEFFDIVSNMNLHHNQKRLLQQLGLKLWAVKSDFLFIQVNGNNIPVILKFSAGSGDKVRAIVNRICQSLSLQYESIEQSDIALDCACEPRQIYEKIRDHCLKKGV
jgi:hypothetical protein